MKGEYQIGSCEYDAARLLKLFEEFVIPHLEGNCKYFFPGNGCKLPLIPGHLWAPYNNSRQFMDFTIPDVPEDISPIIKIIYNILKPFLSGKYEIHVRIIEDQGKELCWRWEIEVEF